MPKSPCHQYTVNYRSAYAECHVPRAYGTSVLIEGGVVQNVRRDKSPYRNGAKYITMTLRLYVLDSL